MKCVVAFTAALLVTALLECDSADAQARGPSAKETLEKGQRIESDERWVRYKGSIVPYSVRREGPEAVQRFIERVEERISTEGQAAVLHALANISKEGPEAVERFVAALMEPGLDAAARENEVLVLETWLRRVPGRFRIGGRIMMQGEFAAGGPVLIPVVLSGEISGVSDCAAVGEGVGVQCILNATWQVIDLDVSGFGSPSVSEALKTLQPAMLVLGLDLEMPGIWALLVTDESIANSFTGELTDNTLVALGLPPAAVGLPRRDILELCDRCLNELKITAEPDSEIVTISMVKAIPEQDVAYLPETNHPFDDPRKVPPARQLIITLAMHRDPKAEAVVPMETKKVR